MSITRLEFVSGSSSKFWQIDEETGLAEWGRIGNPPQGSKHYSPDLVRRMIGEKISKGYRRVTPTSKQATDQLLRQDRKAVDFMAELRKVK